MDDREIVKRAGELPPDVFEDVNLERRRLPKSLLRRFGSKKRSGRKNAPARPQRLYLKIGGALAAALVLAFGMGAFLMNRPLAAEAVAAPKEAAQKRPGSVALDAAFVSGLRNFAFGSAKEALRDGNGNKLYSPASLYMALSFTAGAAKGESRAEILRALSMERLGMSGVESQTARLAQTLSFQNDAGRLRLANSVWLRKGVGFNRDFLQRAADEFRLSSFTAPFDRNLDKRIGRWVAENTGGRLGKNESYIHDPDDVLLFFNTVFFRDRWEEKISPSLTEKKSFARAGGSVLCDFMRTGCTTRYVSNGSFAAAGLSFKSGMTMDFFLPAVGKTPADLLADPKSLSSAESILHAGNGTISGNEAAVAFDLPKFSYRASLDDLAAPLRALGIRSVFDPKTADLSNLSGKYPLYVSKILQKSTVSVDENGCEAAAYTEEEVAFGSAPVREAELNLDRPFLFVLADQNGIPVFIGAVYDPTAK